MRIWFEINLILAFSYIVFFIVRSLFNVKGKYILENATFMALGVMLLFPILINLYPVDIPLPPVVSRQFVENIAPRVEEVRAATFSVHSQKINEYTHISLDQVLLCLAFIGFLFWLISMYRDFSLIRKMIKSSVLIKKYGEIKLYLCPDLKIPCSFWFPKNYIALFSEKVLLDKKLFAHALSHELQHHRQGDTKYIFLMEIFKAIFYINPFTHLWINRIYENRELKCDMEVLRRKGYKVNEYGNTLIDVVKINSGIVLNRTWAMASLTKIKRRIEMITITKKGQFDLPKSFICIALTMLVTWQTLAATRNITGLQALSLSEAQELVSRVDSNIPIEVNESVLKWLNYFIGDPKGKAYMLNSLERMSNYRKFLTQKLERSRMPIELLAVPLMESGYNNSLVSTANAGGIWQFIPSTARRYGLEVNEKKDERLNVDKLTNAAIAYYNDLISIKDFDSDWRLAVIAYNSGENRLKRAIKKQGTKNPWEFNNLGDKEYLAKITAGIILLKSSNKLLLE